MRNELEARPVFTSTLPERPQRPGTGGRVLLIAAVLAILGILAYYAYGASQFTGVAVDSASTSAQRFLDDLSKQNYTAASALLSEAAKQDNSPATLRQQMSLLEKRHGALVGADLALSEPRTIAGLATCKLTYTLRFTSGTSSISLILAQDYPHWRIDSLTFGPASSPMLAPLIDNPPQGAAHP